MRSKLDVYLLVAAVFNILISSKAVCVRFASHDVFILEAAYKTFVAFVCDSGLFYCCFNIKGTKSVGGSGSRY